MYFLSTINILILSSSYACSWNFPKSLNKLHHVMKVKSDNTNIPEDIARLWLTQPLDHFDSKENRTYNMRYFKRLEFWKPNGPIYLAIANEDIFGALSDYSMLKDLANETNGLMFSTSARYYAEGLAMNLTHDRDFFKFLNTRQQLADFANLIKYIKSGSEFQSSKIVLIGYNGGGHLATWMRVLYPNLVDVVVAAGAPLLAKKEFKEYLDVIRHDYEKYGTPDCIHRLNYYYHTMRDLFKNATGIELLKQVFHICEDNNFTMAIDRQLFMVSRYEGYARIAQIYGKQYIQQICERTPIEEVRTNDYIPFPCVDYHFERFTPFYWNHPNMYQACAEYGQFVTTTSAHPPFDYGVPLDYYLQVCKIWFGIDEKRIDEGIAETNRMFGGTTPNVTNVVFTYGELDPNRLLGVQKNLSDTAPVFIIDGMTASNVLMYYEVQSKEAKETTRRIMSLVKKWIASS